MWCPHVFVLKRKSRRYFRFYASTMSSFSAILKNWSIVEVFISSFFLSIYIFYIGKLMQRLPLSCGELEINENDRKLLIQWTIFMITTTTSLSEQLETINKWLYLTVKLHFYHPIKRGSINITFLLNLIGPKQKPLWYK